MLHFSLKALQISIYNTHFQTTTPQAQSYKSRRYFPKNSVFQSILKQIKRTQKTEEKTICNAPQKICNPSVRSVKTLLADSFSKRAINTFKEMDKKNTVI